MEQQKTANKRLIKILLVVTAGMFGFGYALVPLYDVFCEITGINGKTGRLSTEAAQNMGIDKNRLVTVEFLATVNEKLPWQFKPLKEKMEVHPGEINTVNYVATNLTSEDSIGQAIPSVSPGPAASYFSKTECFCFTQQLLRAKETREMPVRFIVDPNLPQDIGTVTLSYTFFKSVKPPEKI